MWNTKGVHVEVYCCVVKKLLELSYILEKTFWVELRFEKKTFWAELHFEKKTFWVELHFEKKNFLSWVTFKKTFWVELH